MDFEERLGRLPEDWKPEPGDKLIGSVTEISSAVSQYGEGDDAIYPIIVLEDDDGKEHRVRGWHSVLKGELAKHRPKEGDRIGVAYFGKLDRAYEMYRVLVERANPDPDDAPVDWDAIASQADAEAQHFPDFGRKPDDEGGDALPLAT